jgi:hypothetical protein
MLRTSSPGSRRVIFAPAIDSNAAFMIGRNALRGTGGCSGWGQVRAERSR